MRSVVCFSDLKSAALYFDRVLPVALRQFSGTGSGLVAKFPENIPAEALINIVFDRKPESKDERYKLFGQIVDEWADFANRVQRYRTARHESSASDDYADLHHAYLQNSAVDGDLPVRKHFDQFATSLGIRSTAVLLPSDITADSSTCDDPVVRMAGLSLIDVTSASWEQILELRRDSEARVRLQRLRSFLCDKYTNKSLAYMEDDLSQRISEYDRVSRKHGFELVTGSIAALLDSSNIQAAAATGMGAALLGGPWLGVSAAAFIELGKMSLEFAKRRRSIVDWQASHELAYVIELQAQTK
jgi:hypothetical protein